MNQLKYHVIPHVHWDREWYFTQSKSLLYSLRDFDQVIELLEKDDSYGPYLLDAQTSILNDYLKYHPHMKERAKKLIQNKRLLTGPWFTQTDQLVISGESIVRNLLYGIQEAEAYGHCFRVGYAVDCFGQGAQMPQIYQQLGIHSTIFKRGIDYNKLPYNEFVWEGAAGSNVFAYHAVDYMNMMNPEVTVESLRHYYENIEKQYLSRSYTKQIFLFNGFDQFPIRKDLLEIIEKSQESGVEHVDLANIEDVLDQMNASELKFPHYHGELTSGQSSRVHKSIFSSRADLKQQNNQLENYLSYIVEPMSVIHHQLTGSYEKELIKEQWKLMMENAAHDSIGTCNSDEVNLQIKRRYDQVSEVSHHLVDLIKRDIGVSMKEENLFQFQFYNLLPYQRQEVVTFKILSPFKTIELINQKGKHFDCEVLNLQEVTQSVKETWKKRIGISGNYDTSLFEYESIYLLEVSSVLEVGALGYETFYPIEVVKEEILSQTKQIENDRFIINVENKTINLYDKHFDRWYNSFLEINDDGDDGDSYDYSEYEYDWVQSFNEIDIDSVKIKDSKFIKTLSFTIQLKLPYNLEERKNRITSINQEVCIDLSLYQGKDYLKCHLSLKNKAIEHRLRLVINADIPSHSSFADQPFGWIERPTALEEVFVWKEQQWAEKPRTIEPMQSYVFLKDTERCIGVITEAAREYQIVGPTYASIAMTLFRSYRWMGKSNLADRPGRASGKEWLTPDNEMKKFMEFEYYLVFTNSNRAQVRMDRESKTILSKMQYHQEVIYRTSSDQFNLMETREADLPLSYQGIEVKQDSLAFSTLKQAEKDEDYILRLYGLEDAPISIELGRDFHQVLLDEETEVSHSEFIGTNEVMTLKLGGLYEKN